MEFAYDTLDAIVVLDLAACDRMVRSEAGFFDTATAQRVLINELDVLRTSLRLEHERTVKAERRALRAENALLALRKSR